MATERSSWFLCVFIGRDCNGRFSTNARRHPSRAANNSIGHARVVLAHAITQTTMRYLLSALRFLEIY